ncbi:glycine betaine ABC transporter substrate-binding protein [Halanaerobium hydrogeniformans]|uniref:Substrate-binding region of ABC-type glycine betaine transport system n=1 Tax=Halanaerobium hydrogeniformans TaxID=656519 RepID=E4RIX9_HALHG|nr:glycine betaine ABC transporter substrate-binding protein [Halanaerobium hydrogeniformans]ADQ15199.1 Substrate-binding region of ABC-type glycine betaine transport system [Halanaerobium hydrogeniformans]
MLKNKKMIFLIVVLVLLSAFFLGGYTQEASEEKEAIRMATSVDFLEREDGIPGLEKEYDFRFDRDALSTIQIGLSYEALDSDKVDVAMGYATDGRISSLNLRMLEDDRRFFPAYNVAALVRGEVLAEHPELEELIHDLTVLFTDEKLIELNERADVDGEEPDQIAEDFLLESSLLVENAEEKEGSTIVVSSKNWTEQLILGSITVQLLENHGYNVRDRSSLGSTAVLRNAIESDQIDIYWEYTGTTLMTSMGEEGIVSAEEAYEKVREWDKETHNIHWLNFAEANNTYTLLMREERAEELNLKTISDLANYINN